MYDVIVVGGGPAGVTAALRARELGANVCLVEKERMGGTCTNDGCVPTRVLAKAARLYRDAAQFEAYGLSANAPALDFERLMKRVQQTVYSVHEKKQIIGHLEDSGIETHVGGGPARFIDPQTLELGDGRRLNSRKFILCAGGRSRRLDFPGEQFAITHSDIWALKKLPASIVIIGGAATGCQVGSILNTFGTQVTILEVGSNILRTEDQSVSSVLSAAFQARNIDIFTGIEGIVKIEKLIDSYQVVYSMTGEQHVIDAEAVFLSTGWLGNLEPLNLSAAGVETVRNYVKVNDYLQTTAEHIFAAGDITGRMMLVQSANYEALAAAENAVLGIGTAQQHYIVPHGGFTDPEYASVGLTEAQAAERGNIVTATVPYGAMDRAVIDDHTIGLCKIIVSEETHRIVGAHVVGEQALEIVHVVAAGMAAEMWVEQLAELQIAYPTFTAVIGLAAREIVRELGVLPLAPQWRALNKKYTSEWERREDN